MAVRKINGKWYVDFWFSYQRYRKKSPEDSRKGAEAYEVLLRQKLNMGERVSREDDEKKKGEKSQTFEKFAWKWFNLYAKNGKKKYSVVKSYEYILKGQLIPHFGNTPINKISILQIEEYKSKKIDAGLANKTINNHLIVLSKSLRCAQEWYELEKIPRIEWLKKAPPQNDFLSHEECDQLLKHASGIWREMILLALKTGLRLGEFRALRWEDINWNSRLLTVQRSYCRGRLDSPKNNKTRHIPLHGDIHEMLMKRRREKGFIFMDSEGRPLKQAKLYGHLRKICKSAGVRRVGWHLFRHTFASHLAMAGAPIIAVKDLLGHSDIQTTMRYAHLNPSALSNAVSLLSSHGIKINFGHYLGNEHVKPQLNLQKFGFNK